MEEPRYIGHVCFAPHDPARPSVWQLEAPFAQITSDGHMIICLPWVRIDGASIPSFLWPVFGHPFYRDNKYWSLAHDQGYDGTALVLPMSELTAITPESLLQPISHYHYVYDEFRHLSVTIDSRVWWDRAMREGIWITDQYKRGIRRIVAPARRNAIYSGVRVGGGRAWRRNRKG